jgi:hypothetical protein
MKQTASLFFILTMLTSVFSSAPVLATVNPPKNITFKAALIPSDTYYDKQWYLKKIKVQEAWDKTRESPEVVVAVLDSGVDINNPDLKDNLWTNQKELEGNKIDDDHNGFIDDIHGWDFVNNVPDPSPKFKAGFTEAGIIHGTVITGIIAASGNNASGVTGVTWRAQIMPLKVLDDKGEGTVASVIKGIDYAINNGADIINLSFVGDGFSQALDDAIRRAYNAGIIVVAAAGNEEKDGAGRSLDDAPLYPACNDGVNGENMVIGVAATDEMDQKAEFSGYGLKCIDIAAPGVSILSTSVYSPTHSIGNNFFNQYYDGYWAGTSMATAIISGAVALIEGANPGLNRKEVIKLLLDGADNINRLNQNLLWKLGKGRVNLDVSITAAKNILDEKNIKILTVPAGNHLPIIKINNKDGKIEKNFLFDKSTSTVASIAGGDINGDGVQEIIVGAGLGSEPSVRIFDQKGKPVSQFLAYDKNFRGGINVATGDINGDGTDEIVVDAGAGGGPQVRVFNQKGNLISQFLAYDKNFRGGVNVAVGDINGDGTDEIVVGAGAGGGPHVRIFNQKGNLVSQFFAFDKNFRGGINVATGMIYGKPRNHQAEVIVAPIKDYAPEVRIFDGRGNLKNSFLAFNQSFRGGVNLATGDINNNGLDEIIVAAGSGGAPHTRVFKLDDNPSVRSAPILVGGFYAYEEKFSGGVRVGVVLMNN